VIWKVILTIVGGLLFLPKPAQGIDVVLRWNTVPGSNIYGYRIYYHPGPSAPPYEGTDALEGASPIEVKATDITDYDICSFQISSLKDDETYYFVTTAIDELGNESDYSNEVCLNCSYETPSVSSGGCMISTIGFN
jgi:hypothetical protein